MRRNRPRKNPLSLGEKIFCPGKPYRCMRGIFTAIPAVFGYHHRPERYFVVGMAIYKDMQ